MRPDQTLTWVQDGTERLRAQLGAMSDEALEGPTALPGWNRRTLFSHLAANADALRNLLHWARTGEERRMYASAEAREEGIAAGALVSNDELRARFTAAAAELSADFDAMTDEAWSAKIITAQGLTRSAHEIPWMRVREVYIHAIDLDHGTTFADLPPEFAAALLDEVTVSRSAKGGGPALVIAATDTGGRWDIAGHGAPVPVTGVLADLAAYLTGRPAPALSAAPVLPPWL